MAATNKISVMFLDIGGVLLTNGWDRKMRQKAAEKFDLDFDEMDERHNMTSDSYEEGKLSLEEYLNLVVFHRKRSFGIDDFKDFMYSQTAPFGDMIKMLAGVKKKNNLKVGAISNEGRELTIFRLNNFGLTEFIDFFICSSFVHLRKPDKDIYKMAMDVGQAKPEQTIYIDDRELYIEVAESMGIKAIHHPDINKTQKILSEYGLTL
jgi:putative hydrolase of the HAD superfamily